MINSRTNLHATGIVIGRQGFLILGPSGSGKSTLARVLLQDAVRRGMFGALISDDQVWIEARGGAMIAHRADTIKDMIEIRYSGIVHTTSIRSVVIDAVIVPVSASDTQERLPKTDETMVFFSTITLPVLRLCAALQPDVTAIESVMATRQAYSP